MWNFSLLELALSLELILIFKEELILRALFTFEEATPFGCALTLGKCVYRRLGR